MNPFDEENFSAWGMPNKTNKEKEYPEQYNPPSKTEQINTLLDNYLENKDNLNKINKRKALNVLAKKLNEIK